MPTQRLEEKRVEECVGERGRERERERERKNAQHAGERERESEQASEQGFGSSSYVFPPPGPALCKLGLARSAVCSTWSLHSGPRTFFCSIFAGFSLLCLLASTILDSFSLFYLPNGRIRLLTEKIWFSSSFSRWKIRRRKIKPSPPLPSLGYSRAEDIHTVPSETVTICWTQGPDRGGAMPSELQGEVLVSWATILFLLPWNWGPSNR